MCACLLEEGKVCVSVQNALNTNSRLPFISHSVFAGGPSLRGGDRMSERLQDNFQVFYTPKSKKYTIFGIYINPQVCPVCVLQSFCRGQLM